MGKPETMRLYAKETNMHSFGAVYACEQGTEDRSIQVRVLIDTSKTKHLKPDHIKDIMRKHFESALEELVYQKFVLPKQMSKIRMSELLGDIP